MSKTYKSQPITFEMFDKAILPRFEEILNEKLHRYQIEVLGFKEEVLGEIKNLRDEVAVALHQYERTNKKVDNIATRLKLSFT